jgi:hypothetical protein
MNLFTATDNYGQVSLPFFDMNFLRQFCRSLGGRNGASDAR